MVPQYFTPALPHSALGAPHPNLVAEFISPKVYTSSIIVGNIIPKSVRCIHSATKTKHPTMLELGRKETGSGYGLGDAILSLAEGTTQAL